MLKIAFALGFVAVVVGCAFVSETPDRLSWEGRSVVFLGDSITDKRHVGCETNYWGFLAERMGFAAHVYGISGNCISQIPGQLDRAKADLGDDVDAVFVFIGTNDFNASEPLGKWFEESEETVNKGGKPTLLRKREFSFDAATVRGRLNRALSCVKRAYPRAQVILMTPIHRGFATFGPTNVQPDERYANKAGYFIGDMVAEIRRAGELWSVPVIDLYAESGLLPCESEYGFYMAQPGTTDMLHPSTAGHERLARVIEANLRSMPPTFR